MSGCNCGCNGGCSCGATSFPQLAPPTLVPPTTTGKLNPCIGAYREKLSINDFVPQAFGDVVQIPVCNACNWIINSCIALLDEGGRIQVQRITARIADDRISITAYRNEYSDETTNLRGPIYAMPLAVCPVNITDLEAECSPTLLHVYTAEAFVMPGVGNTVDITFDAECLSFAAGMLYKFGPDGGCLVAVSAVDGEPNQWEFRNDGAEDNATPGAVVPASQFVTSAESCNSNSVLTDQVTVWGDGRASTDEAFDPADPAFKDEGPIRQPGGVVLDWNLTSPVHVSTLSPTFDDWILADKTTLIFAQAKNKFGDGTLGFNIRLLIADDDSGSNERALSSGQGTSVLYAQVCGMAVKGKYYKIEIHSFDYNTELPSAAAYEFFECYRTFFG